MFIGVLIVTVNLSYPYSLKNKRRKLSSIKQRLRSKFNAAVAETDFQNSNRVGQISFVTVGTSKGVVNSTLDRALSFIEDSEPGWVENHYIEIIKF